MAKKLFIIIISIIILIIISCTNKNFIRFDLIENKNNMILFNKEINYTYVKLFLDNYAEIIKKIYLANNIKEIDIKNDFLNIILVKDNIEEIKLINDSIIKRINKKRNKDKKIDLKKIYYSLYLKDFSLINGVYDNLSQTIIIRFYHDKEYKSLIRNSIFLLLSEYNHHFISENLKRNFNEEFYNYFNGLVFNNDLYKIKMLIDESITHFLYFYYKTYFDSILIYDIINIDKDYFEFKKEHILGFYKQYIDTFYNKKEIKSLNSFFYNDIDILSLRIYYLYLPILIVKKYGIENLIKFIYYIYFLDYKSINDITKNIFNISEEELYKIWCNYVKN